MPEYVDNYQEQLVIHHADCSPTLFVVINSIFFKDREWIEEDQRGIVERHMVFLEIASGFMLVPFKALTHA